MKTAKDHKDISVDTSLQPHRYPGSRPFQYGEERQFYGRESEIIKLANLVELERLVVVYARSGLGKTSLINAGLIPQLEKKQLSFPKLKKDQLTNSNRNHYAPIIPIRFNDPALSPDEAVYKALQPYVQKNNLIDSKSPCFWDLIKAMNLSMANTPVLIFDQFEELFNLNKQQRRKKFICELADVVNNHVPYSIKEILDDWISEEDDDLSDEHLQKIKSSEDPLRVKMVIAIRSDKITFLDELSQKIPLILRNRFKLKALKKEQAKLAITVPAALEDKFKSPPFKYDNTLLNNIVEFLSTEKMDEEEVETDKVESFQLQILCQYIESEVIKRNNAGLLDEALSNGGIKIDQSYLENEQKMKDVLENFYENSIAEFVPLDLQQKVRALIENELIIDGGYRNSESKQIIINKHQIPESVLIALVNCHLLRHDRRLGQDFYEISHDTLVGPITKAHERRAQDEQFQSQQKNLIDDNKNLKKKNKKYTTWTIGSIIVTIIMAFLTYGFFHQKAKLDELVSQKEKTIDDLKAEKEKSSNLSNRNKDHLFVNHMIQTALAKGNNNKTLEFRILNDVYQRSNRKKETKSALVNFLLQHDSYPCYNKSHGWHKGDVRAIAIYKDYLITGGMDNKATLWKKGSQRIELKQEKGVKNVGFFKNKYAVTTGGSYIYFWDLNSIESSNSAKPTKSIIVKNELIYNIAIDKSMELLAVATNKGNIFVYDDINKKPSLTLRKVYSGKAGDVPGIEFLGDNGALLYTGLDKTLALVKVKGNDSSIKILDKYISQPLSLATSGDSLIAVGYKNGMLKILKKKTFIITPANTSTEEPSSNFITTLQQGEWETIMALKAHESPVSDVEFSPKAQTIATSSLDRTSIIWDLEGNKKKTLIGHQDQIFAHTFDPKNENRIFTVSEDNSMKEWLLKDFFELEYPKHESIVRSAIFGNDGEYISGSADHQLHTWNSKLKTINNLNTKINIYDLEKTTDKQHLLIAGSDGAKIWDFKKSLKWLPAKRGELYLDIIELDTDLFAACTHRGYIYIFDKDRIINSFMANKKKATYALDYCKKKDWLISGGEDSKAVIWNLKGDQLAVLMGHNDRVRSVAISKNGNMAVTGSWDNTLKIWDLTNEQDSLNLKFTLEGHSSDVSKIEIHEEEGHYVILSASSDQTVRLWKVDKQLKYYEELKSMINHRGSIKGATFSDDGKYILTCGADNTVKLWPTSENEIDNYFKSFAKLDNEVKAITKKINSKIDSEIKQE